MFALVRTDRKWTEKVLHSFAGYDGSSPVTVLTRDRAAGILYGTAFNDGPSNCGTAFRLDPANRRFNVLYNFQGGQDGCLAKTQLREGWQTGTLFGGTLGGGGNNCGTLFQLTKTSGSWNESVLHAFTCTDGSGPEDIATPSDDPGHSIYGVALGGGKVQPRRSIRAIKPTRQLGLQDCLCLHGGHRRTLPDRIALGSCYRCAVRHHAVGRFRGQRRCVQAREKVAAAGQKCPAQFHWSTC